MKQRGRAGRLGTGAEPPETDKDRPEPPHGMPEGMAAIWRETVNSMPAGYFTPAERQRILRMYCAHAFDAERFNGRIEWVWDQNKDKQGVDYSELDELTRMRDRETKAALNVATKLRLTPQSQEPPPDRGKNKKGPAPWAPQP